MIEWLRDVDLIFKVILGGGAVALLMASFYRWAWPVLRRLSRGLKVVWITFVGSDPIREPVTGREVHPARPALAMRLESIEESHRTMARAMTELATQSGEMAEMRAELVAMREAKSDEHSEIFRRLAALEQASVERIVTRAESAAMWSAVSDEKHPPPPSPPLDPPADITD